jgi:polygalacturonase
MPTFNVLDFGALGDGRSLDTLPIQRAIDAAAAAGAPDRPARLLLPGRRTYLVGTLHLAGNLDFHLADDARLLLSLHPGDYSGLAALQATGAANLQLSGTGTIDGRSPEIMTHFDAADEWWFPIPRFRPRLALLNACRNLIIRDLTFQHAPLWTLHLVGCANVLIDGIRIRNQLDVPNCDGIDPDACQDVEIKNCDIVCGDDAIVLKSTREGAPYGPCKNIHVHDCTLQTQDSGLKIGTETVGDISDVLFERCTIRSSCRGLGIQLRDPGSIYNITFRDIHFRSQYHSKPWWGRGEAISLTAIPRLRGSLLGALHHVHFQNITGIAENSARISGSPDSRIHHITLDRVALTLDRWTRYPGSVFDNRPTKAQPDLVPHDTPGFYIEHADHIALTDCSVAWGKHAPPTFTSPLETLDVTNLTNTRFHGKPHMPHPA